MGECDVEIPDEAIEVATAAIRDADSKSEWAAASADQSARAALTAAAPVLLASFLDDLIADPDNYTASGAFRPIVLVHHRAELRATPAASPTQDGDRDG